MDAVAQGGAVSGGSTTVVTPPRKPLPALAIVGAGVGALLSLVIVVSLLAHKPEPAPPPALDTNDLDANTANDVPADANAAGQTDASNTAIATPAGADGSTVDVDTAKSKARLAAGSNDASSAAYWWLMAANEGDAEAQYQVGRDYATGQGVNTDLHTAVYWFQKSADQGYADGEDWLALEYTCGCGVDKDMDQARAWYVKAAAGGNSDAQDWLNKNPAS